MLQYYLLGRLRLILNSAVTCAYWFIGLLVYFVCSLVATAGAVGCGSLLQWLQWVRGLWLLKGAVVLRSSMIADWPLSHVDRYIPFSRLKVGASLWLRPPAWAR
jgi:hypothetical protein